MAGFSLLELMLAAITISVLVLFLSSRLREYEGRLEKARMESEVAMLQAGIRIRMAELLIAGGEDKLQALRTENPFAWLHTKLADYGGQLDAGQIDRARPGRWYFDAANDYVIYVVADTRDFHSARAGSREVRYRVELVMSQVPGSARFQGAKLVLVEPYQWF